MHSLVRATTETQMDNTPEYIKEDIRRMRELDAEDERMKKELENERAR